jgi:hypothetical protein
MIELGAQVLKEIKRNFVVMKNLVMPSKHQAVTVRSTVGRRKEFSEKRIVVTLIAGTRAAIDAVRGKQVMTEFIREAISKEIAARLAKPRPRRQKK